MEFTKPGGGDAHRHRVDREVAAHQIVLEALAEPDLRIARHLIVGIGAERGDLQPIAVLAHTDRAEFDAGIPQRVGPRPQQLLHLLGPRVGGEVQITAERIAAELDKLLLGRDPVAGIDLMVQTGLGDVVLPEVGGMRMAIDEHHQHKDVYWHSLTVLRQAIALEDEGPDLVLRWAARRNQ